MEVDPAFARWVLKTIKHKLRPRFLVCLGLKGKLRDDPDLRKVFETTFGLNLREPHEEHAFPDKGSFEEWNVVDGQLKIVLWPNSPSRFPFEKWKTACEEFKNRNRNNR